MQQKLNGIAFPPRPKIEGGENIIMIEQGVSVSKFLPISPLLPSTSSLPNINIICTTIDMCQQLTFKVII